MKSKFYLILFLLVGLMQCKPPQQELVDYSHLMQVDSGIPVSVMLTSYSTTLIANGVDESPLRIAVTDSLGKEIRTANNTIQVYLSGDASITHIDGSQLKWLIDTAGMYYTVCQLHQGVCQLKLRAGISPGIVKVEARSGKLWPGAHEIHTLYSTFEYKKPTSAQLVPTTMFIDKMIGADVSFLPQLEDRGMKFYENGKAVDALALLKLHGFNYIRLRIFVNPENEKGYAPQIGYCGLDYTLKMAQRVKDAGMKLLLDFHYSDYWADPQQQYKPLAWQNLDFETLKDSVEQYTVRVLKTFKNHNLLPDMVQIGNEINHGLLWPEGHIGNPDQLAELLKAGVAGAKKVAPEIPLMMHIALGGQNKEAVFWLDNMIARGVAFDVIGLSYYSRWHGMLNDLNTNLNDLIQRYKKPVNVVEYSGFKREVHDISFGLPDNMGKGACIWEPLNWHTDMFNQQGEVTRVISIYDELSKKYLN
jgi:beta-galactosidase